MKMSKVEEVRDILEEARKRGITIEEFLIAIQQEEVSKVSNEDVIKISEILKEIGIPANLKGYRYLRQAILLVLQNPEMLDNITKILYPEVAKLCNTTVIRVERSMRHAIKVAWERGEYKILYKYFGCTVSKTKRKPSNSEFVATIADYLKIR